MSTPLKPRGPFPAQGQLLIPLLEEIAAAGGEATTPELCDRLAERVGLTPEAREARVPIDSGRRSVNGWDRWVRWTQQRAKLLDLAHAPSHAVWALTGPGDRLLRNARPGVLVILYETDLGSVVWGDAYTAAGIVEDGSIDLVLTSPPYPLGTVRKPYESQLEERRHVDWLLGMCERWKPKIADTGSLVLNVANTWIPGVPAQNAWVERLLLGLLDELGFYRAQEAFWNNPAALPSPAEWVTVRRQRVKPEVEHLLWLVKDPHRAKSDNRKILVDYSASMRRRLAEGGERGRTRPSGHSLAPGAFGDDRGGAIPGNLVRAANTQSRSRYQQRCHEAGLPVHPARFPRALAERFIQLTTERGDLIADCFAGSGTVAEAAERLGRRWILCDLSLTYLAGSAFRLHEAPGFRSHVEGVTGLPSLLPTQTNLFAA